MAIKLNKETMSLDNVVTRNSQMFWIEQDVLVPDSKPDVMKIIGVESVPYISNTEVVDGGIRVTGEITYYIIYRSMDNDKTRGITMTYPFAQNINIAEAKKGMSARVTVNTRNILYSLPNERKISIKTELVYKYTIREKSGVDVIVGIEGSEDIESQKNQDTFYNVMDIKQEIIDVKEDIVVSDNLPAIGEILRVGAGISNTDYKVSYNKILVKGDVSLEILYLEKGADNILTYTTQIPFAGMIEFDNISEASKFDIKYDIRNLEIVLGENNMLSVNGEITVDAIMYEEKEVSYISDFYSIKNNLKYDKKDVVVIKNKENINKQITVKDNVGTTDEKNRVIAYSVETEHLNTKVAGASLYIDGPLKINVTFVNKDTGIADSKTYDLLVDTIIPLGKEVEDKNVDVNISAISKNVSNINGNVEVSVTLDIDVEVENIDKITTIGDIEDSLIGENEFSSMYMYIVKKGDTLWDIAKKYKTTVAKIANTNNITDENKIDIGQKILIIR